MRSCNLCVSELVPRIALGGGRISCKNALGSARTACFVANTAAPASGASLIFGDRWPAYRQGHRWIARVTAITPKQRLRRC